MAVSPFTPAKSIDDNNDLLQSIRRAFGTLPLDTVAVPSTFCRAT